MAKKLTVNSRAKKKVAVLKSETAKHAEDSTRVKLQKAALKLFAQQGYGGTSTQQICEAAGANTAAIAYHFETKEKLFMSILTDRLEVDTLKFGAMLKKAESVSEFRVRLEMFCDVLLETRQADADLHQVLMSEARHFLSVRNLLVGGVAKVHAPLVNFLKDAKAKGFLSRSVDPDFIAIIIFSHCISPSVDIAAEMSPSLDTSDEKKRPGYLKKLLTILENGILNKESQS